AIQRDPSGEPGARWARPWLPGGELGRCRRRPMRQGESESRKRGGGIGACMLSTRARALRYPAQRLNVLCASYSIDGASSPHNWTKISNDIQGLQADYLLLHRRTAAPFLPQRPRTTCLSWFLLRPDGEMADPARRFSSARGIGGFLRPRPPG